MSTHTLPIRSFLAYLDRIKPGYLTQTEGKPLLMISLAEHHQAYELPQLYQAFLYAMGINVGPLLFPDHNTNGDDIETWYGGVYPDMWPMSDAYQLLAFARLDEKYWLKHWVMALDEPIGKDDVMVFQAEGGQDLEEARRVNPRFHGLRDLLYFEAFTQIHITKWGNPTHILRTGTSREKMDTMMTDLDQMLTRAGLAAVAPTSSWLRLYENESLAVGINRNVAEPDQVALYIGGVDQQKTTLFVNALLDYHAFTEARA